MGGALVIELTVDPDRRGEDVPAVRDRAHEALLAAGYADEDLHLTGLPVIVASVL